MNYEVMANVRLKGTSDSDYIIVPIRIRIGGAKALSLDQLFEFLKREAVSSKGQSFEYIINLKVTPLKEGSSASATLSVPPV